MHSESTRAAEVLRKPTPGRRVRRALVAAVGALPAPAARGLFWALSVWDDGTRAVLRHPGTWRALEPFYTLPRRRGSPCERLWGWALENARGLPERLHIVVGEITSEVRLRALQQHQAVRVLSIGSGSARPVLEAAAAVDEDVELLLDIDSTALDFSQSLATDLSVPHTIRCVANILRAGAGAERELRAFQPDIVELVGLLDYLNDRLAALMLNRVARFMPPGSVLLAGNVVPNAERPFFDKALQWPPMVYRAPDDFIRLVEQAGFAVERVRHDQYGLHTVVKARRLAAASAVPLALEAVPAA